MYFSRSQHKLLIGTLGPNGTSSENSANYYAKNFLPYRLGTEVKVYDNFNNVLDCLLNNKVDLAIVPHAYSQINEFYINPELSLIQNYEYDTPEYGLYKLPQNLIKNSQCTIVSHPAPVKLIKYLLKHSKLFDIQDYVVNYVDSTVVAANLVKYGHADIALTNKKAAEEYSLELIAMYGVIHMGWSVFSKRKDL